MIFRALAVFSRHNEPISPPKSQGENYSQIFRNASAPISPLIQAEKQEDNLPSHYLSCQYCLSQQSDFCPYCNYPGTLLSVLDRSPAAPSEARAQRTDNTLVRRRKLRKVKPEYQHLRYEPQASTVEIIASPRPESILSTNSRTALLNPSRTVSSIYTPRRIPNKLEKRNKMHRMTSMSASSSGFMTLEVGNCELSSSSTTNEEILPRSTQAPSNIGTEDLVSFAWNGEVQDENSASSSCHHPEIPPVETSRPRPRTKSDYSTTQRRSILRKPRDASAQKTSLPRPRSWSLAMVLTDDKITDEKFVDQLEDIRVKELSLRRSFLSSVPCPSPTYQAVLKDSYAEYPPQPDEFGPDDLLDSSWNTARQALLICREMLRTERRYLLSLRTLAKGGTATFPPFTMLYHLPLLITASEEFEQSMTKNPSVRGVSEAFLAIKENFDEAFVNWCNVVGTFFADDDAGKPRSDPEDASYQTVVKLRKAKSTPMPDAADTTMDNVIIIEPKKIRRNSKARPSVRELAILPTQRVVRYVLLFKELSALIPPSASYSFVVAQALHAAQSIAKHSDEAQTHAAFLVPST